MNIIMQILSFNAAILNAPKASSFMGPQECPPKIVFFIFATLCDGTFQLLTYPFFHHEIFILNNQVIFIICTENCYIHITFLQTILVFLDYLLYHYIICQLLVGNQYGFPTPPFSFFGGKLYHLFTETLSNFGSFVVPPK